MSHSHDHSHEARPRRMVLALGVLVVFLALELAVGLKIGSLALLADAGHMVTDIAGIAMGLVAVTLAKKGSTSAARTFGWHRAEVLTAVANAVLLLGVAVWVMYEAMERIGNAPRVPGVALMSVAAAGLVANVVSMLALRSDSQHSLAVRGAYLEVMADAVGSIGVLIAGAVTLLTQWHYADIVVGVLISLWVAPRAVMLGLSALRILVQASPSHVDVTALRRELDAVPDVRDVHDLHVWTLTTGKDVATAHVTTDGDPSIVLAAARDIFTARGLPHATIQVEPSAAKNRCDHEVRW